MQQMKHKKSKMEREKPPTITDHTIIKGGGVILIGPIPIIFGSDYKYAVIAMLLAIILIILVILSAL